MIIGERIRRIRLSKNYSQEQLGKLVGVTKVSISGYENGTRIPKLEQFEKLISVLDVSPSYLLGLEVNVIEEETDYNIKMSKDDIKIISELKTKPELYNKIVSDPERMIELISRRVK
ncbi:MAG: helix-turn-helix transcriptional regulator [Bacilli bacterium]|nr:helix-turn-helix transcriptional regulator [Bacilli bacterium]MBQ8871668.1 helix-turn-helix transcriptional regulator [Bacilli bacterium]